jgi:outer membrane protein OmpA-like peptidoglycan-associated protein
MDLTDLQLNWAGSFTGIPLSPTGGSTSGDGNDAANGGADTDPIANGAAPAPGGGSTSGDVTDTANAIADTNAMANGPAPAPGGGPGGAAGNEAPLKATDTDIFFAKDAADLTADDKASLDAYAKAYTNARSTDPVTIDGFASNEGDAGHNKDLSQKRAQTVADYLVSKGVAKDTVTVMPPHGGTKQFGDDLPSNRRVTLAPKPPAAPATTAPAKPIDIDPNSPQNQKAIQDALKGSEKKEKNAAEADDWIRKHLKDGGLRPDPLNDSGDYVMFNNGTTKLTDVIDSTVKDGQKAPIQAPDLITPDRVQKIAGQILRDAIPKVPGPPGKNPANTSLSLQYQFVPFTDHKGLSDGKTSTDQPAHQIQLNITAKFHGEDESGAEIQGQLTGTLFADGANKNIQWQQVQGGAQVAWVQKFFNDNLEISPQLAVSFGGSRAPMGQTQTLQWTPTGQVTAGGQVTFKVPGFKGKLLVGTQGQVGVTGPSNSQPTFDKTWVFTLTYNF